jgi:hypothetical protein
MFPWAYCFGGGVTGVTGCEPPVCPTSAFSPPAGASAAWPAVGDLLQREAAGTIHPPPSSSPRVCHHYTRIGPPRRLRSARGGSETFGRHPGPLFRNVRINITQAAFDAICATLPGNVGRRRALRAPESQGAPVTNLTQCFSARVRGKVLARRDQRRWCPSRHHHRPTQ